MSRSQQTVAPSSTFQFIPRHVERLRLGIKSPNVWPGGRDHRDLGLLTPEPGEAFNHPLTFGLELRLAMDQREFHAWEPVELSLGVAPGVERTFEVPDVLDPGYDAFDLWIERPNGERLKYRPSNFYCLNSKRLRVAPGHSFERDLSVFGQSGGYTFRHVGIHRLSAELRLPEHGLVRSNSVEVNVLPQPARERSAALGRLLYRRSPARLLFYRDGRPDEPGVELLSEACARYSAAPSAAAAHYALGRFFLRQARRARWGQTGNLRAAARDHLERAAGHKLQSRHRRDIATQLLADIPPARRRSLRTARPR